MGVWGCPGASFTVPRLYKRLLLLRHRVVGTLLRRVPRYFYSVLGMECFAGELDVRHPAVNKSSYGHSEFHKSYNFDTWCVVAGGRRAWDGVGWQAYPRMTVVHAV